MAATRAENNESMIFMYGATKDEGNGHIGYPRRWSYVITSNEEIMAMLGKMSEDGDSVRAHSARDMIKILRTLPQAHFPTVVSESDSDKEVTYEPTVVQCEQEKVARSI